MPQEDIKDALQEVGSEFTIIRDSGNVSGEYLDYAPNTQVTKPFIREFFLEATMPYDTAVSAGEILRINKTQVPYMVMNLTPELFEGNIVEKSAVLYKCNVSGELLRPSGEAWDTQTYQRVPVWQNIRSEAFALITEIAFGTDLDQDEDIGQIEVKNMILYIPSSYGAQPLDRYQVISGEHYKIETVLPHRFDNVDECEVSEDTRL